MLCEHYFLPKVEIERNINYTCSYMKPEVKKNFFSSLKISNSFHNLFCLHGDFTAATFHTIVRLYYTCRNNAALVVFAITVVTHMHTSY